MEKDKMDHLGIMFEVAGYTTLLILNKKGQILERNEGALYHSSLRSMLKAAIKKNIGSI